MQQVIGGLLAGLIVSYAIAESAIQKYKDQASAAIAEQKACQSQLITLDNKIEGMLMNK